MKNNFSRIIVSAVMGIAILTMLMIVLENAPTLVLVAYGWSVWGIIMFALAMGYWAMSTRKTYILHAAYPMLVKYYLFYTLLIAFLFGTMSYLGIWSISWKWFCLIEFVVLAIHAWRLQAVDAAKEEIVKVEEYVESNTSNWRELVMEITAIAERGPAGSKKVLTRTMETIRYADPMERKDSIGVLEQIFDKVNELSDAVDADKAEEIESLCTDIERLVKRRSSRLKDVK